MATVLTLMCVANTGTLCGQTRNAWEHERLPPAVDILRSWEAWASGDSDELMGYMAIGFMQSHRDQVSPPSRIEEVLDGLESLILTTDNRRVQMTAVSTIATFSFRDLEDPLAGGAARLRRVYAEAAANDASLRRALINAMGLLAEGDEAADFLMGVAQQTPEDADFENAPYEAVFALSMLGEPGSAALRHLHANDLVKTRRARNELKRLERQNYTRRPERQN